MPKCSQHATPGSLIGSPALSRNVGYGEHYPIATLYTYSIYYSQKGMKVVLQRVREARVTVEGKTVGEIGAGLLCLVGIGTTDTSEDIAWIRNRILGARLWPNADGGKRWDKSVKQLGYGVLLVSQFTLHGIFKGNKPDFHFASKRTLRYTIVVS